MTTLYTVGPKGADNGKPWLMTGEKAIAEKYALEMEGEVREKKVPTPTVFLHVKRER